MPLARVLPALLLVAAACSTAIDAPDPIRVESGVTLTQPALAAPTTTTLVVRLPADAMVSFAAWSSGPLVGLRATVLGPDGKAVTELTSRGTSLRIPGFRSAVNGGDHTVQVAWTQGEGVASYRVDVVATAADPYRVEHLGAISIAGETSPRAGGVLVTLPSTGQRGERVLLAGGYRAGSQKTAGRIQVTGEAVLIDPLTGATELQGGLATARAFAASARITEGSEEFVGKVLVAGGIGPTGAALASTEIYDPGEGLFSPGPPLPEPRAFMAALAISGTGSFLDGKILLAGGELTRALPQNDLDTGLYSEVDENPRELVYFDPTDGSMRTITPKLTVGRLGVTPVLLDDARIFFVGGGVDTVPSRPGCEQRADNLCRCNVGGQIPLCTEFSNCVDGVCAYTSYTRKDLATAAIDVYDTSTGRLEALPKTAWLNRARVGHVAAVLPGDRILVAGGATAHRRAFHESELGLSEAPVAIDSVELFEPETNQWRILTPLASSRDGAAGIMFGEASLALVGGVANAPGALQALSLIETYGRRALAFEPTSQLAFARYAPMVARVNAGNGWLVVGGEGELTGPVADMELVTLRPVVGGEPSSQAGRGSSDADASSGERSSSEGDASEGGNEG